MTRLATPAPRRAMARLAFIRSLAKHTPAIRELRLWRLPSSALVSEHDQELFQIAGGHPFFDMHYRPSQDSLYDCAGDERVQAANEWGKRWKLDVTWAHAWAVFALIVWEGTRRCNASDCPYNCVVSRSDEEEALRLVLTQEAMITFGEHRNHLIAMLETVAGGKDLASGAWLPIEQRPIVAPLPGPHPLLETNLEYMQRAQSAWDQAVTSLVDQGISLSAPRRLELHCEWLVRYHVLGHTAAEILKDVEDTDPSTVYKAVKAMADGIGLPLRQSRDT